MLEASAQVSHLAISELDVVAVALVRCAVLDLIAPPPRRHPQRGGNRLQVVVSGEVAGRVPKLQPSSKLLQ